MISKLPIIAIVGRPNVGKSTLFNRLLGRKTAIVHDRPGITRDRNYAPGDWCAYHFNLVDTGGYEVAPSSDLYEQMRRQVEIAIREAQKIILVVDGRAGLNQEDRDMAMRLRKSGKDVLLAVNKIDNTSQESDIADFYNLGFKKVFGVSAEHGRNVSELLDAMIEGLERTLPDPEQDEEKVEEDLGFVDRNLIRVSIIGRPNVGKSTLLNRLYGAPRAVVHSKPGTTRDPLDVDIENDGKIFRFIDTAGIRKKAHAEDKIEKVSVSKTLERIEKSDIALMLIDASEGMTAQDGKVAQQAVERRRPLILLANKWDALTKKMTKEKLHEQFIERYPTLRFVPIFPISAKTGLGMSRLYGLIEEVYTQYTRRLKTAELNKVFRALIDAHPPPNVSGRSINMLFATQVAVKPPRFAIMTNHPNIIPEFYKRYLGNGIRKAFDFKGTPLELEFTARKKKRFHA